MVLNLSLLAYKTKSRLLFVNEESNGTNFILVTYWLAKILIKHSTRRYQFIQNVHISVANILSPHLRNCTFTNLLRGPYLFQSIF